MELAQFAEFAAALWQGGSFAYYWSPNGPERTDPTTGAAYQEKISLWFPAAAPMAVPDLWLKHHNVYFGVHPSSIKRNDHRRALAGEIECVNCLFAEFDAKTVTKAEILQRVGNLPALPSVLIDSGGGYHAYWLLSQTLRLDTPEARARVIEVQHAWNEAVGGEKGVNDLARVLRVPGAFNCKPERGPDFPMVRFVSYNLNLRHEFANLERIAESVIQRNRHKQTAARSAPSPVDIDDASLLEIARAARGTGPLFARLWDGDTAPYSNDHSKADQALVNMLAFWTGKDTTRMDRLFRASGLMRDKWNRDDYRTRTLDLAVTTTVNVYTPGAIDPDAVLAAQSLIANPPSANGAGNPPPAPPPTVSANSASAPQPGGPPFRYFAEDGGILDSWLLAHGQNWLFVNGPDRWCAWQGTHWATDEIQSAKNNVLNHMLALNHEARDYLRTLSPANPAHKENVQIAKTYIAATQRSKMRLSSVEGMAQVMIGVRVDDLDQGNVLNLANGILDLDTEQLLPHDRSRRMTYCLPYDHDPAATCPRWKQFLREVLVKEDSPTTSDYDLILLFQELVGYTLTTDTQHEAMV